MSREFRLGVMAHQGSSGSRRAPRSLFLALLAVLAWLPLPLGSNRPWAWSLLEVAVFLLLGLWFFGLAAGAWRASRFLRTIRWPLGLLAVWLAYQWLLTVPLPRELLGLIAARTSELYVTAEQSGVSVVPSLAIDVGAAQGLLMRNAAYLGLLLLIVGMVDSRRRLLLLVATLAGVGLAESLYGLAVYLSGNSFGFWQPNTTGHHVATGTFVNRNHFGAHLGMTLALGLGLLALPGQGPAAHSAWRTRIREALHLLLAPRALLYAGALVMAAALILSHSRGAILAFALGVGSAVVLSVFRARRVTRELRIGALLLVLAAGALLWLGSGDLERRFSDVGLQGSERLRVWGETLEMIRDRPLFGVGGGGYQWMYPSYKGQRQTDLYYDHAHNDYLEFAVDFGVIGLALILVPVAWLMVVMISASITRRHPFYRAILFGSTAGSLTFLLHGLVDFNFQIPANAAYFYALLGIGVCAASLQRSADPGQAPGGVG